MAKKKSKKNHYFTIVHQHAIIEYAETDDPKIRNDLYVSTIGPAFDELVNKIVCTYKFYHLPNIDSLKNECKEILLKAMNKFDGSKGFSAFSYFSAVTKNFFIAKVKKHSKQRKTEVSYEDIAKNTQEENLVSEIDYESKREFKEFWDFLLLEIDAWEKLDLKAQELKVLKAVRSVMKSVDDIEIFNKKAVYLYLRELTGLDTKQIVNNLNKMRERYGRFKRRWNNGSI